MPDALKIRKIGNSLGVILPGPTLEELDVEEGDELFAIQTPDGMQHTPYDPKFAERRLPPSPADGETSADPSSAPDAEVDDCRRRVHASEGRVGSCFARACRAADLFSNSPTTPRCRRPSSVVAITMLTSIDSARRFRYRWAITSAPPLSRIDATTIRHWLLGGREALFRGFRLPVRSIVGLPGEGCDRADRRRDSPITPPPPSAPSWCGWASPRADPPASSASGSARACPCAPRGRCFPRSSRGPA